MIKESGVKIPDSFLLKKFYNYSYNPSFKKGDGVYNAGCPVCKEGKSLGKKKRLFFYPKTQSFYCFNCSKSWNAFSWILEVSNNSVDELKTEILQESSSEEIVFSDNFVKRSYKSQDLPVDSINLTDNSQVFYYKDDLIVKKCLSYIKDRKLDTAINKCENFYISLKDYTHKNRLCIPFYEKNKITFYQTRSLDESFPKYLSKSGGEKGLFNINNIDEDFDYIFLTEGPIDSMFIKNGVGVAGLNLTDYQKIQLSRYPFHKKIWILDNPAIDQTAKEKIQEFVCKKENVFMWPLGNKFKDLNEWCIKQNVDGIDYNLIINNIYPV
jgi:hypothetical protein